MDVLPSSHNPYNCDHAWVVVLGHANAKAEECGICERPGEGGTYRLGSPQWAFESLNKSTLLAYFQVLGFWYVRSICDGSHAPTPYHPALS